MTAMQPEPTKNDLSPVGAGSNKELEPILLLDTSGSMSWPAAENSKIERREVIGEAIRSLVTTLGAADSQAEKEAAAGEDAGGLMTVIFSDPDAAIVLDDLSTANYKTKWDSIEWGGGTYIMPGWTEVIDNFLEEFGKEPVDQRPALCALIITDGEAEDADAFAAELAKVKGEAFVVVAIIGYGETHDATLAQYQKIAQANDHVRVVSFNGETDPNVISQSLLSLLGH